MDFLPFTGHSDMTGTDDDAVALSFSPALSKVLDAASDRENQRLQSPGFVVEDLASSPLRRANTGQPEVETAADVAVGGEGVAPPELLSSLDVMVAAQRL